MRNYYPTNKKDENQNHMQLKMNTEKRCDQNIESKFVFLFGCCCCCWWWYFLEIRKKAKMKWRNNFFLLSFFLSLSLVIFYTIFFPLVSSFSNRHVSSLLFSRFVLFLTFHFFFRFVFNTTQLWLLLLLLLYSITRCN